ncbi:tyrosine-type recombinase/integrase [Telluria beijingensis]|uniref:tyrosine-type recombinase/integrase n=1 Tax=Telluria beijingensis TaxID=3068633 RepID=UPI0027953D68|nr:site-specific integrase [Massilia sp. REN29]
MAKENFTAERIKSYQCEQGKQQTIHWDAKIPGLGLRVTQTGTRAYIFESRLFGKTIRITIGDPRSWDLGKARAEGGRLKTLINQGLDPRELKAEAQAAHEAKAKAEASRTVTVGEAWGVYLEERRPYWGDRHYQDHVKKAQAGGQPAIRGTRGRGLTIAGPLHALMELRLCELRPAVVEAWAAREKVSRPTSTRLAWRLLKSFLSWCAEQPAFAPVVEGNPAKTKKTRELLGPAGVKQDALQLEQLPAWFAAVRQIFNPVTAAYLQTLLLTGARPGEVLEMRWEDVDTRWKSLTIRDKVEGERIIPLTPYVSHLLAGLPRRSEWVFSSSIASPDKAVKPISKPHQVHDKACTVAGIEGLTLHGLRRSFASLTEWLECPIGVVAQIMGHKPSATAEKHYKVRPLDLLRRHHEHIEAWILKEANIEYSPDLPLSTRLQLVASA